MRANKSGLVARGQIIFRPILHSSHPPFLRPDLSGADQAEAYSFPIRVMIIVGFGLSLWMIIGLFVSLMI